jgi:DNA-binding MarR family transcriptional regulator
MSRAQEQPTQRVPLIALADRLARLLKADMVTNAHLRGRTDLKLSHNAVFGTLNADGSRAADMAAMAGITRQSMGEAIRELVDLGILEMAPDPEDRRAKIVRYTEPGLAFAREGYQHILELEQEFADEFGAEEYETTRRVLARIITLMDARSRGVSES